MFEIDLLLRRSSFTAALEKLETLASKLEEEDADVYHRVRLLITKAHLLDKCGVPLKGFSVAVRAANIAHRARLLPALWQAIGAIANILVYLKEFEAASELLDSIMPQVCNLSCTDLA